ncbi:14578_t:CDS:2 [Cetraspora pellucida]|uniref:14578_t:CDS:1 n=1 Tax=Cetraspora pellucida TaxID=1433469 RepID=A0A9N9NMR9_9GLOM|nr:14578_t:CDS:2 [Cetraspora pellucida]
MSIDERREQSQRASQSIGQYLLQGWALIDEICPNDICYGIPLLRSRDKKKYCVICQQYYINESDLENSKCKTTRDFTPQTSTSSNRSVFNEEKHKVHTKDAEIIVASSFNNYNETLNTAQKVIISKIEELSVYLQDTIDLSEVKSICDAIKNCAQTLEVLRALNKT